MLNAKIFDSLDGNALSSYYYLEAISFRAHNAV